MDIMVYDSPLRKKAYAFALKSVLLCKKIIREKQEYVLSRQLMKSATSIGANIEEAQQPESRKDFISKISISMKEGYETRYWISLLRDAQYIEPKEASDLLADLDEILAMTGSSIRTAKQAIT